MKLTLTQRGVTVTIEDARYGHTVSEMAQYFRQLLLGQGYTQDPISALMPTELELDDIVSDAIADRGNEAGLREFIEQSDKRIDKDEGLTEDCGNI